MEGYDGWPYFAAGSVVSVKATLVAPLKIIGQATLRFRSLWQRLQSHAELAAQLKPKLPTSAVVMGRVQVYGTGNVRFGENALLYPDLHLETQGDATIEIGHGVVISRGVHLVAMASIRIGDGCMIGEYASVRDANHSREAGIPIREAAHAASPITIGRQVWIGRGASVLAGVTIGDNSTVGANAVVTRDIEAWAVVGGVPARPLRRNKVVPADLE